MRLGLVSFNPIVGDVAGNLKRLQIHIEQAAEKRCRAIVFPELALVGYPPRDLLNFDRLWQQQKQALLQLKRMSKQITIFIGATERNTGIGRPFFNSLYIFQNNQTYIYRKRLLPNHDVFDEARYFEAGKEPLTLRCGGIKIGMSICEDIWFPAYEKRPLYQRDPITAYKNKNIDLLLNISASPYEFGKLRQRLSVVASAANQSQAKTLSINQLGGHDDLIFDGGTILGTPDKPAQLIAPRFTENLFIWDYSAENQLVIDEEWPALRQALVIGIRDYVQKTGFQKITLGLSGGMDSAIVAQLATEALGAENVLGVLLPSRYSSAGSVTDAELLAKNLGIQTKTIKLESIHSAYEKLFAQIFTAGGSDLTHQNIQARIRGAILMAIANEERRLLLNTTNKSEMAMGYGTLYGDLCGALAPLSDLLKTEVYQLAHHMNPNFEKIPREIFDKAPSAELKPGQLDTDSLPPYDALDPIISNLVLRENVPADLSDHDEKIRRTIMINEYKRRQSPIGLKVSSKAFGSGRKFPVAAKLT